MHDLYALYPDYDIDVAAEQAAAAAAGLIVLLHPIQWYSMPALQKLWLDEVLTYGWAYGPGGTALQGKDLWLVATTGGPESSYHPQGYNRYFFDAFLPPYEQTAALCGMRFLPPLLLHGAHRASEDSRGRSMWRFSRERLRSYPQWPELDDARAVPGLRGARSPTGPPRRLMEHAPAWLTNSLIYLGAAVIAVPLSRALGLGSIIGYLAAGIAIGPWGLGLVSNVEDILHFAEFGVVLMLFLVGLELEPRRLWSLRRPIFGWGSAQVLGCAALLCAAGMAAGLPWRVSLVAALGLALSSTAIALQVMGERNLLPTSSGQAGFSILLFQDVAAIPILALLPLLGGMAEAAEATAAGRWLEAAKILGVIGGIVLGGRLLLRPLLRWIAKSRTPEIFTAASLLLVVAIAALMQLVGLSMALGAFLAGVLLAESEYRRELETDIEPFKGLLLGLFFIAVGMSIDFGVLLASPGLMAAIVLGFLALKGVVIYALARAMGLPVPGAPGVHAAAGAGRRVRLRRVPGRGRRAGDARRDVVAADRRGGGVDAAQPLAAGGDRQAAAAALRQLQHAAARGDQRTAARAHHHRRLRALRADRRRACWRRRASPPPCWTTTPT